MVRRAWRSSLMAVMIGSVAVFLAAGPAVAGTVGLVGGGASGVIVQTGLVNVGPTPSVTLPATGGGPFTDQLASVNVPNVLTAGVATVSTEGALGTAGFSRSSAQLLTVNVLNGTITADAVSSQCAIDSSGTTTGSSSLVNANATGVGPLSASPPANTTLTIPLVGTLILNEQTTTTGPGGNRSITVNAVHLHLTGLLSGDIILSQSRCTARI